MKNILVAWVLCLPIAVLAANGVMKGAGIESDPWQIEDYKDLKAIGSGAYLYSHHYVLTKDVDASASANERCDGGVCSGFKPIAHYNEFSGTIDGRGHTIRNLMILDACGDYKIGFIYSLKGSLANLNFDSLQVISQSQKSKRIGGLTGYLNGTIKNVHVIHGGVSGTQNVGGGVGYVDDGTLTNVSFQGFVVGSSNVGGLVGYVDEDAVIDSSFAEVSKLDGLKQVGGIAGYSKGKISFCKAKGVLNGIGGGVVGFNAGSIVGCSSEMELYGGAGLVEENEGRIEKSFFVGAIRGIINVGGLAVRNNGTISNSFAQGLLEGSVDAAFLPNSFYVAGLVVENGKKGIVQNCYAANAVRGNINLAGLVGENNGTVTSSYWNVDVSGVTMGEIGEGLTNSQMMSFANFDGWDTTIWKIDEGKTFPYLDGISSSVIYPIAIPTKVSKWQNQPVVAALVDMEYPLVGEWSGSISTNKLYDYYDNPDYGCGDSLYYGYRIGYVNGKDTVWGSSSYMAVPNKIEIGSLEDLKKIGKAPSYPLVGCYELTADIDGKNSDFKPIGDSLSPFLGGFDGKKHTISNLKIVEPNNTFVGLFGYVANLASVENLVMKNVQVNSSLYVGALAGKAFYARIQNVVSYDGFVSGLKFVGGLIGKAENSNIDRVANLGTVIAAEGVVGGVCGLVRDGTVLSDAFSVSVVKGHVFAGGIAGGIDCNDKCALEKVYSVSLFNTPENEKNGIAAYSTSSEDGDIEMTSAYYDSTIFKCEKCADSLGRSTEKMLKQSTFKGFDFENIWTVQEGISYPYFKGMEPVLPGTLVDDGSTFLLAGFGTESEPYQIWYNGDLKLIGKYEFSLDRYYKLYADIDGNYSDYGIAGLFSGSFDGNGKTIRRLEIERPDDDNVGLFSELASEAKVFSLVIKGSYVTGKNNVGSLAGIDHGAEIYRVAVDSVHVYGKKYVGGMAGKKMGGRVEESYSKGKISADQFAGGLFGSVSKTSVLNSYSTMAVSGSSYLGGISALVDSSNVQNVYSANRIVGASHIGGVTDSTVGSTYASVYYDSTIFMVNKTKAGELRTTSKMTNSSNFVNWDFENVWSIGSWSYPYLQWSKTNVCPDCVVKESYYGVDDEFEIGDIYGNEEDDGDDSSDVEESPMVAGAAVYDVPSLQLTMNGNFAELSFTTVKSGSVKFCLMDMQGRIVYLKNMGNRAAGAYVETLDFTAVDKGLYIGALQVNGRVSERTMLKAF